jgi:DNA polymerase sigma
VEEPFMLSDDDVQSLNLFAARIRESFPEARVWAFGSRARGNAEAESDLDTCVVLEQWTETIRKEVSHIAWEVGFAQGVLISTIVFSREEFYEGPCSESPLVSTIRKEGVAA